MNKNNMKIKDDITLVDKINAIDSIVHSYFTMDDKTGEIAYTPYFEDTATIIAIVTYFIEGIEFDEDDSVYDCAMQDEELKRLVNKFIIGTSQTMEFVMKHAKDKVDFLKQRYINHNDDFEKIGRFCDVLSDALSNIANLDIKALTPETIAMGTDLIKKLSEKDISVDSIIDVVKSSAGLDMGKASEEIIDHLKVENRELKRSNQQVKKTVATMANYKRKEKAKNVLADKKGK